MLTRNGRPHPKTKHTPKRTLECKHLAPDKWEHGRRPRASQKIIIPPAILTQSQNSFLTNVARQNIRDGPLK